MNEGKLNHIRLALHDMAFLDIKRASDGKSKMGAFILASCFIEYMAGFVAGHETKGIDYKQFVKDYLPNMYNPKKLYTDLRCKLVHNYSEGGSYIFAYGKPDLHGKILREKMMINLENFIDDIGLALKKVIDELTSDPAKWKKAEERYDKIDLLGIGKFEAEI